MKRLCFGSYLKVLYLCRAENVTQPELCQAILSSLENDDFDTGVGSSVVSDLISCRRKLSPQLTSIDAIQAINDRYVTDFFTTKVLRLLNVNERSDIANALKDIIATDEKIKPDTTVDRINGFTKEALVSIPVSMLTDIFAEFLAGVFLYTVAVNNLVGADSIKDITKEYIDGVCNATKERKGNTINPEGANTRMNNLPNQSSYSHPTEMPSILQSQLRKTDYHTLDLQKSGFNRQAEGIPVSAKEFYTQHLLDEINRNSIVIVGEGGAGKSTLIAHFFEENYKKAILFYVPINELDYGFDEERKESISSYLYKNYFKNSPCEKNEYVYDFISTLDNPVFVLEGYNELEQYHTESSGELGEYNRVMQLDNDIMKLRDVCQNRVIVTSRYDIINIGNKFVLFELQRVSPEVVRSFLDERKSLLTGNGYTQENMKDELVDNLRTPLLLNAFDGMLRSSDLILQGVSLGMFEHPTKKGQIFYNYLCCEMFKNRDNHKFDAQQYAIRGMILLKYIVPHIARYMLNNNATYILQRDLDGILADFLAEFNAKYVHSQVFDDINYISRKLKGADLAKIVALDIGEDGNTMTHVLLENYRILYGVTKGRMNLQQGFAFQHQTLGEVLAIMDMFNEMAMQNIEIEFNHCESVLAKTLSIEAKEFIADLCAVSADVCERG